MPVSAITGTEGADVLVGLEGVDDTIQGLGGNDIIVEESVAGSDFIFGGDGDDWIRVRRHNNGAVTIDGGAGNDRIEAWTSTPSYVTITTGSGSDILSLDGKFVVTDFTPGNGGDRIDWTPVLARLIGWDQASNPFSGGLRLRAIAVNGSTVFQYSINPNANWQDFVYLAGVTTSQLTAFNLSGLTLNGAAPSSLTLNGTDAGETLQGLAGNDTLLGNDGNDFLYGGIGNDTIVGGDDDDYIDGELGSDTLVGGGGNDTIVDHYGSSGTLDGGFDNDTIIVNLQLTSFTAATPPAGQFSFFRVISGGGGNDIISFVARKDTQATIDGGNDNDEIHYSGTGTNISVTLSGGIGHDLIDAAAEATIDAGSGNDTVIVGAGTSVITLGSGVDTVRINPQAVPTAARITDFQTGPGGDIVDLIALLAADPAGTPNPVRLVQVGTSVHLRINSVANPTILVFEDRSVAQFTADNFAGAPPGGEGPPPTTINGTPGDDVINGTPGSDTINGLAGNDTIRGGEGDDKIVGDAGNDFLFGEAGNDLLFGGAGNDRLEGGAGDDAYFADSSADQAIEAIGGGTDIVFTSANFELAAGSEIEILSTGAQAGTTALTLVGNEFANLLYGNAGANLLAGGGGADVMVGLGGDDTYFVDNAADRAIEGSFAGADIVYTRVSYALEAGSFIEFLSAFSNSATDAIDLTGNEQANTIYGNNGVNNLRGGGGSGDVLIGLGGNDVYHLQGNEQVIEAAGGGIDVVYTGVNRTLAAGQEIEILSAVSNSATTPLDLFGNEFANVIYGNNGFNFINGQGGNDVLMGFGGADFFAFTAALGAGNVDHIVDFASAVDLIRLDDAIFTGLARGRLSTNAFFVGAAAHDADDRIIYDSASGNIFFDADGNGAGAAILFAHLPSGTLIVANDFEVI